MVTMSTLDGGGGAFRCIHVTPLYPDPCLSNNRRIVCEEGLHRGPRLGRSSAPVLLDTRLNRAAEFSGTPLVLELAHRNPGVYETPGFHINPRLIEAFPPRWLGNSPPEINEHAVNPVRGHQRPEGESCLLPKVALVRGRRGSSEATQDQVMVRVFPCVPDSHVLE